MRKIQERPYSVIDWLLVAAIIAFLTLTFVSIWGSNIKHRQFQERVRRTKLNIVLAEEMKVGETGWIEGKVVYNNKASRLCWLLRKAEVLPKEDKNHMFRLTRKKDAYEIIHPANTDDFDYWISSYREGYVPPKSDYFPLRIIWDQGVIWREPKQ
jgi:hypothetical protein